MPPRMFRPSRALLSVASLAALFLASAASAPAARRHTHLVRSVPAKDTVVSAVPPVMQLWFSEAIELGVSRVRLQGADSAMTSLAPLTRDAAMKDAPVTAPMPATLADGRYTVHWSTASKDGHVARGSFAFTVRTR